MKSRFASILLAALSAIPLLGLSLAANAQTLTIVYQFGEMTGDAVFPALTQVGSRLYGTTSEGGTNRAGTVFAINADGSGYTLLHQFVGSPSDGDSPSASLTQVGFNTLYGMTTGGGISNQGTVFAINTDGSGYTLLHQFVGFPSDGAQPGASLTLVGSTLYGTTVDGGTNQGTVFAINTDGSGYTLLHQFVGSPSDGLEPEASLTQVGSMLYGTTPLGGTNNLGTVFAINTDGSGYTILHKFVGSPSDGSDASTSLRQVGSTLYGTTPLGGTNHAGTVFAINTDGSGYTILHQFVRSPSDGFQPDASLTQVGSTLYGTTAGGGTHGEGTVFVINTDGSGYTLLHEFPATAGDGIGPYASLTLAGSTLYGTTVQGGTNCCGTVFALTPPGSGGTNCTFSINSTNAVVAAVGGSNTVSVTTSNGCAWNATTSCGFITITSGNGGSGDGTVGYTVAINSNTIARVGTLIIAGQTFTVTQASGDSVGNGIPNWWRAQYFGGSGTNTNSVSCATCDPDGDGMDNTAEYLTGTNPTNSASCFHITSTLRTNNNLRISWMTGIGRTNALQVSTGTSGSYATNFTDIFTVTNTVGTTTNYLDVGGATNAPSRYYRVRLIP